jgi:hypothetical protein
MLSLLYNVGDRELMNELGRHEQQASPDAVDLGEYDI